MAISHNPILDVEQLSAAPRNKYMRVPKTSTVFNDYKGEMAYGGQHPLHAELEYDNYILMRIGKCKVDGVYRYGLHETSWEKQRQDEELRHFLEDPKIAWANEHSFDGVYITKEPNYSGFETLVSISCYMKEENAVWWRLKF